MGTSRASVSGLPRCLVLLSAVLAVLVAAIGGAPPAGAAEAVTIESLAVRADLVSGGDALLRLTAPDDASVNDLQVTVDRRDLTDAFVTQPDGTALGLVTGLAAGDSVVRAELPSRARSTTSTASTRCATG